MKTMNSFAKQTFHRQANHYSELLLFETAGKQILDGVTVATFNPIVNTTPREIKETTGLTNTVTAESDHEIKSVASDCMLCHCCQATFTDREEQHGHYTCDWHRYNLHRRLKGLPCVSEEEFEEAAGDVSSISGSDEEDDCEDAIDEIKRLGKYDHVLETPDIEDQGMFSLAEPKFSKVFFKTKDGDLVSLFRCLLHHKKNPIIETDKILAAVRELPQKKLWIILMVSSGHFAGAVFNGKEVIDHKTFHRYTVRAKRGTAQSSKDSHGGAPKSAGATLRRYNEGALVQDVQDLLLRWGGHIQLCSFVFVRIPVANRSMFFGGKTPIFKKDDSRIRVIPFATRRPTFSELKRVHQILASVESYGKSAEVRDVVPQSTSRLYNNETGQLVLQTDSPKPPRANTKHPARQLDTLESGNDSHEVLEDKDEEIDMDLVETLEEISFSELKQFDNTVKKKQKKKSQSTEKHNLEQGVCLDKEMAQMKNALYTACKIGCLESVQDFLEKLTNKQSQNVTSCTNTTCGHVDNSKVKNNFLRDNSRSESAPNVVDAVEEGSCVQPTDNSHHQNSRLPSVASTDSLAATTDSSEVPCSSFSLADFLNTSLGDDGSTYLHVATKGGHAEIVNVLLISGADPSMKNKDGKVPYNLADSDVRNEFRRFMAKFPDRYDYTKAQIPSPLTAEMEAEKKQKAAEKRKAKKKAMNERKKDTKHAEEKLREETQAKERFLALSEREKRALAAEKRILQHCNNQGLSKPVLSRCWQCGSDITGKIPFEYCDYKFCTTKCLREHRSKLSSSN